MRRVAAALFLFIACAHTPPPQIGDELRAMSDADQALLRRSIKEPDNAALRAELKDLEAKNVTRLREIVRRYGWPGRSMVGDKASGAAWLIAQHADSATLHQMLTLMKQAVAKRELEGALYATSLDRVLLQDGKKQLYGSQFDTKGDKCEPLSIEDPEHVDARRQEVGLGPLAEYAQQLCAIYKQKK